jgi:hypothetical protein
MIRRIGRVALVLAWLAALGVAYREVSMLVSTLTTERTPAAVFTVEQLRHPPAGVMLGVYIPGVPEDMRFLEDLTGRVRRGFRLISVYQAWGSAPKDQFDAEALNKIVRSGAIPVLTWEPWVTDFTEPSLAPMPAREFHNLRAIGRGDYDFYIRRWAIAAKRWHRPLIIRLGHEMNASWYPWGQGAFGNSSGDFKNMWRHVVDVFRSVGADNVLWAWTPARLPLGDLYPGDAYVDWVGMTVLNFGTAPPGWKWASFADLFRPYYAPLKSFNKPIMIAEVASAEQGGDKARWITEALDSLPAEFPAVRALMWYNAAQDKYWQINWSLESSHAATRAFQLGSANPYFLAPPR